MTVMANVSLSSDNFNFELLLDKNYYQKMQFLASARNHNKENQSSEPAKELQKLKLELNDRTFQLHKLEEDYAQEKAKIFIQLQKEKQIHAKTIKELRDKIKDDNEGWVRMVDDLRKEKEMALASQQEEIQSNCRKEYSRTIEDLQEKHVEEVTKLKRCIEQKEKTHRREEEQWVKERKNALESMTQDFRKQEQEKERKHSVALSNLRQQYEEDIGKLRSIYLKEQHLRLQADSDLKNAIKSHVRERIAWEHSQNGLNMQINSLQQRVLQLQEQLRQLSDDMKTVQQKYELQIQQIKIQNSNQIKKIQCENSQKQKQNSCFYSTQIQNLKIEIEKLLDIHRKKEESWVQSGKMVLQLYEKRESKKEDVKAIQKLEVELIKKDFLIERERNELKNCKLELENMEQIYDRIFVYNSNLNRSKVKSYQIKKLKTSCQLNQSNRSTIISDKNLDKRYLCEKNE